MRTSHRQALENFAAKKGGEKLHPLDVRNVLLKLRQEKMEAEVRTAFEGYSLADLNEALSEYQGEWEAMHKAQQDELCQAAAEAPTAPVVEAAPVAPAAEAPVAEAVVNG